MKTLVRTLAVLYGLNGLLYVVNFAGIIRLLTDPSVFAVPDPKELMGKGQWETMLYTAASVYLFEAVVSIALTYGFWNLRAWGRYLGLIYSSVWLLSRTIMVLMAWPPSPTTATSSGIAIAVPWIVIGAGVLLRGVTLGVCLRQDVKELMCN